MLPCDGGIGRAGRVAGGVGVMEERDVDRLVEARACASRLTLRTTSGSYPILRQGVDTCIIVAPEGARLRGYADIYDGDVHRAHCLIVLSEPDGELIRLTYKRRTAVTLAPPADFAPE
jgi:hypothetical protein